MTKDELRQTLREQRAALSTDQVNGWSAAIRARLTSLDLWRSAGTVHCYVGSLPGEVRTDGLIRAALQERKRVICPRVRAHGQLEHREVADLAQMVEAPFGLREPSTELSPPIEPKLADLVVAPGVGFTLNGARLGMGGGYYDRMLAQLDAPTVGLAFEMQVVPQLPQSAHDQPVDIIVTELRVIRCR